MTECVNPRPHSRTDEDNSRENDLNSIRAYRHPAITLLLTHNKSEREVRDCLDVLKYVESERAQRDVGVETSWCVWHTRGYSDALKRAPPHLFNGELFAWLDTQRENYHFAVEWQL